LEDQKNVLKRKDTKLTQYTKETASWKLLAWKGKDDRGFNGQVYKNENNTKENDRKAKHKKLRTIPQRINS